MKGNLEVLCLKEIGINDEYQIKLSFNDSIIDVQEVTVLFNREWEQPSIIKSLDKVLLNDGKIIFSTSIRFTDFGNYYFFFRLKVNGQNKAIKLDRTTNEPCIVDECVEDLYWKVLVTQEKWIVPEWSKDSIYYQLRVDRFCKGKNNDFRKKSFEKLS